MKRLALIGGEEFADGFEQVHASLLADVGRKQPRVVFLPTCAADDGDEVVEYWRTTARDRLSALGASVEAPRVVDTASANDADYARLVAEADWIYLGGGYPHVAMRILPNTRVLEALYIALARGALISGASGGAMLMGARAPVVTPELTEAIGRVLEQGAPPDWNPPNLTMVDCLSIVPRISIAPHFDRPFASKWLNHEWIPAGFTLIGIDEQTALVTRDDQGWQVRGRGAVTLVHADGTHKRYSAGMRLVLNHEGA